MSRLQNRSRSDDARLLAAVGLLLGCWGLVHIWFWGSHQIVDTPVYEHYGDLIVHHHQVPYRDFAVEYPPGALPAFAIPSLAGDYAHSFAWLMLACAIAMLVAVARLSGFAALFVAVSPLLVGSMIYSRFDLWPALLVVGALVALVAERHRLGWALLGAAVAAKLWPLALVPLAVVWSVRRGRARAVWSGVAVVAAVVLPFAVLAPHGLWQSVHGQADRPLQIESLGAAFATTFAHPRVISTHGSQNLAGYGWAAALLAAATVAVLVALWISFARGVADRDRLLRYAAAVTCATIAFGKVLSPQFLIWLVPIVPLVRGRRGLVATALLAVALVLTQIWFPARYFEYALGFHLAGVVLARDLVLVALLAVLALPSVDLDA